MLRAATTSAEQLEFFETRIRPVLVEHCYPCHNSTDKAAGELALDHRDGLLRGGEGGAVVVVGQPQQSRLLPILRHEVAGLEMPQDGPQLDGAVVADFQKWIAMGLPDPRDAPPSAQELTAETSWQATLQRRKQWWSLQPLQAVIPSSPHEENASDHPIDLFIGEQLASRGLTHAAPAAANTLVRRLYWYLIGLPPSYEEAAQWSAQIESANPSEKRVLIEQLIDQLLERPQFGERWARHWMDWIRYAESHGSEGDPAIDNAWMYRDYLIRALNADVPYDQLVREHVAGDLLERPRINAELGINESMIGPAHWRMVFHGFAPTDPLDERVRFTDDQINAFSKAFLGLTISCARCHDHKFDAISQKDYYALFGILSSCRPARTVIDVPARQLQHREALEQLKPQIRQSIADDWLATTGDLGKTLLTREELWKQADKPEFVLYPLFLVQQELAKGTDFTSAWAERVAAWQQQVQQIQDRLADPDHIQQRWDLSRDADYDTWFRQGLGLPDHPQSAGEFSLQPSGELALTGIYPAGVYSHAITAKHAARLTSGNFVVDADSQLWLRVIGDGDSSVRYVVQNYPRDGTVYPVARLSNTWRWQRYDVGYWQGDELHIELATGPDAPLLVRDNPRSWFGVREAAIVRGGRGDLPEPNEHVAPIFEAASRTPPKSVDDVVSLYQAEILAAIEAWKAERLTDSQALLLDACLRQGILPNQIDALPGAKPLLDEYRQLESDIPGPRRVPGLEETVGRDQPLYPRGNHKRPGDKVPRRFLEAIDPTPYDAPLSGRRRLAEDLLRDDNPIARRVIVNRVWHHLFGRGLVATPDNLGQLGQPPTHPELLDWLAQRFVDDGWSLKKLIRLVVTSATWQQSSLASPEVYAVDPDNLWLAHANLRRLDAEGIRDALLSVSGQLDPTLYGPSVESQIPRRSVYVRVLRNSLDPFLRVFDFPEPFTATGARQVTNVPAQSLTMMNDPVVAAYAAAWADRVLGDTQLHTDSERIERMFLTAFSRPPTDIEVQQVQSYLAASQAARQTSGLQGQDTRPAASKPVENEVRLAWIDLCQAMFTMKEFMYVP